MAVDTNNNRSTLFSRSKNRHRVVDVAPVSAAIALYLFGSLM